MADQHGTNPYPVIPSLWTGANTSSPVSTSNPLPTQPSPAANLTTLTTGQATAGTATGAAAFVPALAGRKALVITNAGTVAVYLGNTGVTTGTGHYLGPGQSLSIGATDGAAALAYFVITASSTALCTYAGWS